MMGNSYCGYDVGSILTILVTAPCTARRPRSLITIDGPQLSGDLCHGSFLWLRAIPLLDERSSGSRPSMESEKTDHQRRDGQNDAFGHATHQGETAIEV